MSEIITCPTGSGAVHDLEAGVARNDQVDPLLVPMPPFWR